MLVTMGWMNIFSSSYNGTSFEIGSRYGKQMIMIIINVIFLILIFFLNRNIIPSSAFPVYILVMFSLIAVLVIGKATNGATSWFSIGGFKLQPAEFAKIATALLIAKLAGKEKLKIFKDFRSIITICEWLYKKYE